MLTIHQETEKNKILNAFDSGKKIAVLQGTSGVGKTHIQPYIIKDLGIKPYQAIFSAYTGTAVLNMQQEQAMTLHSLLYKPIVKYGTVVGFKHKNYQDLAELLSGIKMLVIDEFSMVPHDMMQFLEEITKRFNVKMLLIGDYGQLPPIGQPNKYFNVFDGKLTEPMRQALESPILRLAYAVRNGEPIKNDIYDNKVFVGSKNDLHPDWLKTDTQIICGTNKARLNFNQQVLGGRTTPEVGDKIIFLRHDLEQGVSNGTQGIIQKIDYQSWGNYEFTIIDERNNVLVVPTKWNEEPSVRDRRRGYKTFATHAYAITCHKSQGKTIHDAGLIWDESNIFRENSDKWKYTALTRFSGKRNLVWLR